MDENELVVADTPEARAAEEAAFTAGFAESRGEEPEAGTVVPDEPVTPEPTEKVVDPVEVVAEVEPAKLFAGLTEEQIGAALARSGTLQGTVDKMAGRIGQLMQQIESLRTNPPTTQQAQKALDLKLEKLSGAFPELANLLREDLAGLSGSGAAELPASAPAGITQEQFDAALASKLNETRSALTEQMEIKVLTIVHPDWNQIIKTNEFALWRDNVLGPEAGRALMLSEDSAFISQNLTNFKKWRDAAAAPAPESPKPAPVARTTRLSNAVLPAGNAPAPQTAATEEDAFIAGFNKGRKSA